MHVKWLRVAKSSLDHEMEYISKSDYEAAVQIYAYIMERVSGLAEHPHIGRQGRVFGTRELVIDRYPYIIPYRVNGETVEILRVFHTSRKPPKQW